MSETGLNYRDFIVKELKRRQALNPAYSLRAFARDLNVTISRISEVLTGKTGLSVERALHIAQVFEWEEDQTSLFIDLVESEHNRSPLGRKLAKERLALRTTQARILPQEEFSLISEWYYVPMIELLQTKPGNYSPAFLGQRLGLDERTATEAIMKLQQLKLIEWKEDALVATNKVRTTPKGIRSEATRKFHKQILKKAEAAIDTQPLEKRSITSAVMAVDQAQLQKIQERIREFRNELMKEIESAPAKNAVYCMSLNFFEMTVE
jgi:uncharacterized protein (TIGR02147 family)